MEQLIKVKPLISVADFLNKLFIFQEKIVEKVQDFNFPITVEIRPGSERIILSLKITPDSYNVGNLDLWYDFSNGYYWYKFMEVGSNKKYSNSLLLNTDFLTLEDKANLDLLEMEIMNVYKTYLKELDEFFTQIKKHNYSLNDMFRYILYASNSDLPYTSLVLLPIYISEQHDPYKTAWLYLSDTDVVKYHIDAYVKRKVQISELFY